MRLREFFFSLQVDGGTVELDLIVDLAAAVLRYAGCAATTIDETTGALRRAAHARKPGDTCTAQFRAGAEGLQLLLTWGDGQDWRVLLPMP